MFKKLSRDVEHVKFSNKAFEDENDNVSGLQENFKQPKTSTVDVSKGEEREGKTEKII